MLLRRRDREKWVSTSELCTKRTTKQHPTGAQQMAGVGRKVLLMIISPRPLLKVGSMAAGCSGSHQPCLGSLYRLRLCCLHGKPVPVFNQPHSDLKKSHIQQEFSQKQQHSDHEHLFVDFCKQWKQKHHWNRSIIARDAACWPSVIQRSITSFPTLPFETL